MRGTRRVSAAVVPGPCAAVQRFIVGEHDPAFSGGEVLARLEAEGARIAERADRAAAPAREPRLRGVLDDPEAAPGRDGVHAVHVGRASADMHRQDGRRALRDRGLDQLRVQVVRARLDVDERGDGAQRPDGVGRRHEAVRARDDLVAGLHPGGDEGGLKRQGAVAAGHGVPGAVQRGEAGLKLRDGVAAQPPPAGLEHFVQRAPFRSPGARPLGPRRRADRSAAVDRQRCVHAASPCRALSKFKIGFSICLSRYRGADTPMDCARSRVAAGGPLRPC